MRVYRRRQRGARGASQPPELAGRDCALRFIGLLACSTACSIGAKSSACRRILRPFLRQRNRNGSEGGRGVDLPQWWRALHEGEDGFTGRVCMHRAPTLEAEPPAGGLRRRRHATAGP